MKKILFMLTLNVLGLALAQLHYRGEIGIAFNENYSRLEKPTPDIALLETARPSVNYSFYVEADYDFAAIALDNLRARVVAKPNFSASINNAMQSSHSELGLSEAFISYRGRDVDVSVGLERLPLEVSRLTIPFSLETRSTGGVAEGLLGIRASYYLNDYRFRAAAFYQDERLQGLVGVKNYFGDFELEASLLYTNNLAFGLTGSGLLGETVVYGEAWFFLNDPISNHFATRLLLGATGYLGDGSWTAEGGYYPSFYIANSGSIPQVAVQYALAFAQNMTLSSSLSLGYGNEQLLSALNMQWSQALDDASLSLSTTALYGASAINVNLTLALTMYF